MLKCYTVLHTVKKAYMPVRRFKKTILCINRAPKWFIFSSEIGMRLE